MTEAAACSAVIAPVQQVTTKALHPTDVIDGIDGGREDFPSSGGLRAIYTAQYRCAYIKKTGVVTGFLGMRD